MDRLNDIWIDTSGLDRIMNGDKDKIFIIEEKETISYQHAVVGAKNRKEAIEIFEEYGSCGMEKFEQDGRTYGAWKIDDSHEWHKTFKPTVLNAVQFKKCALKIHWDCQGVVDMDENVCESCLDEARKNSEGEE